MMEVKSRSLKKSNELWNDAQRLILSGVQLYSKGPETHIKGVSPIYIDRGKAAHVWDVDGNEYIDYDMGLGPILLGYCYKPVDGAIKKQLERGMGYSLVAPEEVEYAKLCVENIPCAEKVRFLKTGSGATEAAIRIARAYTGKKHILRGEYHGWHEWTTAAEDFRQGGILPELKNYVHKFDYNDFDTVEKYFEQYKGEIAAVITEPVQIDAPKNNFLENLLDICHQNGAVLIFDEVVDGFRFSIGGAQKYFGVTPDLATFGKAAANGMPLSIVAGKHEVMDAVDKKVFISTTFGGECLSLVAGIAVMKELKNKPVTERLWSIGKKIQDTFNFLAEKNDVPIQLAGYPVRLDFRYSDYEGNHNWLYNSIFMQECVKRGVLLGWHIFPCYSHTDEDVDFTLNVFEDAMKVYKKALNSGNPASFMEGEPLKIILG